MLSKGVSTLGLIVAEFQNGCGQMVLASPCVLHPLNRLVLDFEVGVRGWVNEWGSGGVLDQRWQKRLVARGGVKACNINGTE